MSKSRRASPAPWLRHTGGAIGIILLLFGCAFDTQSADAAFGGNPTPPSTMSMSGATGGHDGIYVGTANVVVNGSYGCRPSMKITNFEVVGNMLRFGGFRATIAPDGSIPQTVFRGMWITGHFDGTKFVGGIDATGDTAAILSSCIYSISVTRAV